MGKCVVYRRRHRRKLSFYGKCDRPLKNWLQERAIAEERTAAILSSLDGSEKAKILRFLSRFKLLSPLKRDRLLDRYSRFAKSHRLRVLACTPISVANSSPSCLLIRVSLVFVPMP